MGKLKTPSPLLNRVDSPETTHSSPVSFSRSYSNKLKFSNPSTTASANLHLPTKKRRSTEQALLDPPLKRFRSLLSASVDEDLAEQNLKASPAFSRTSATKRRLPSPFVSATPPSSSPPPSTSPLPSSSPPPIAPLPSLSCPVVSLPSSSPASPRDICQRLRLLQTALVSGVLASPTDHSNTYDFNQTTTAFRNRVLLLLRMAAVSYSSAISASDIELLDRALSDVCMIQNGTSTDNSIDTNRMNQLCQIIARVARIQVVSGVANLPSSRASQAEVYAFNDLKGLCVRGSVLEKMSQNSQSLGLLYHRANVLLI